LSMRGSAKIHGHHSSNDNDHTQNKEESPYKPENFAYILRTFSTHLKWAIPV